MGHVIEDGIRPLVDAINTLDCAGTIYSCEGHFDGDQNELFLPTAYVTFSVEAAPTFARLYERLLALDRSIETADLRLTYDCVLGRYTLSIWPRASFRQPSQKRAVVDSVIRTLSDAVLNHQGQHPPKDALKAVGGSGDAFPCGEPVAPCTLVIPRGQPICPFKGSMKEHPETLG